MYVYYHYYFAYYFHSIQDANFSFTNLTLSLNKSGDITQPLTPYSINYHSDSLSSLFLTDTLSPVLAFYYLLICFQSFKFSLRSCGTL